MMMMSMMMTISTTLHQFVIFQLLRRHSDTHAREDADKTQKYP